MSLSYHFCLAVHALIFKENLHNFQFLIKGHL